MDDNATVPNDLDWIKFSIAPMMDWTDRHCRFLHRLLSRRARLYTEMVTTAAVLHGDRARLLGFDAFEHPVAVQLGGNEPAALAQSARICEAMGYAEINLNCGCPSDRVQSGAFGACLMHEPQLVGDCVAAMKAAVRIPVTVKCRIGVDDQLPSDALYAMAHSLKSAGADGLFVHARKAWLKGLSPKQNRDVPPLEYPLVYALKRDFDDWPIAINGGIETLAEVQAHLREVDGVMLGRAAYNNPALLLDVDPVLFGVAAPHVSLFEALEAYVPYIEARLAEGVRLADMTRHMLGFFAGQSGARAYRRHLATQAVRRGAGVEVLRAAISLVERQPVAA